MRPVVKPRFGIASSLSLSSGRTTRGPGGSKRFAKQRILNVSPANAGVHISTARAAGRWVPAFAGTAARAWFHLGQVGCPAGTKLAMTISFDPREFRVHHSI